jgi:hypothetical protein
MALGGHPRCLPRRVGGLLTDVDAYDSWLHDDAKAKAIVVDSIEVDL